MLRCKAYLLIIFLAALLLSCSEKKGPVIGFMLPHMTIKRYPVEKDEFIKRVKEAGGDVIFMSADNDEAKQDQQVHEILDKGIDVLVLDPVNRFQAAGMVRAAHDQGVSVISYDRLVANCDVDAFLTFDASQIGSKMTSFAMNLSPSGKYIVFSGDKSDINAVLIDDAITKTLAPGVKDGKIEVVYKIFIEKYSAEEAEHELSRYFDLSMDRPDVILCASDVLAKGALKAINSVEVNKKIIITGQNADAFACREILNGNQAMTIYKPVKKLATLAAEIAINLANGKKVDDYFKSKMYNGQIDVPAVLLDVVVVDRENIRTTVLADGLVNEDELK